jgi:hypothetical protein
LRVFSELQVGLSPTANVIATNMLFITMTAVITAQIPHPKPQSGTSKAEVLWVITPPSY